MEDQHFNELNETVKSLEINLLSVINELKASTSVILKELTVYLNVSANDITKIRESQTLTESFIKSLKDDIKKIDEIYKKILELPKDFQDFTLEIESQFEKYQNETQELAKSNYQNVKRFAEIISKQTKSIYSLLNSIIKKVEQNDYKTDSLTAALNELKNENKENQEEIFKIINTLIQGKENVDLANIESKNQTVKATTEKSKVRWEFWAKLVAALFSSSGILWFIIKIVEFL